MKKLFVVFAMVLALGSASAFSEEGFRLNAGVQISDSLIFKTFLGARAGVDYQFSNGLGFGLGSKFYWNTTRKNGEALFYPMVFGLFEYKAFYLGGGMSLDFAFEDPLTFYLTVGGAIPIWQAGRGKIGLDFGLEAWTNKTVLKEKDSESEEVSIGILNIPKFYFGVSYFLPF